MRISITVLCFIFLCSCNSETNDCGTELICTEEFRSIQVEIVDTDGNAVLLDTYQTIQVIGQNLYDFSEDGFFGDQGHYTVLTDAQLNSLQKEGEEFIFQGTINGLEVINESFTIGHDCCHISLLSGPEKITLSN
jgi:hypothetical protein